MEHYIFKGLPINDPAAFSAIEKRFHQNKPAFLSSLPWLVAELVEHIGLRETLEFIYREGGRKIYLKDDHKEMSSVMGLAITQSALFRILQQTDSSGYLEIPSPWGVSERMRKAFAYLDYLEGADRETIRRTYGLSSRAMTNLFSSNR